MVSTRRDDWHKQPGPVTGDTAPGFTTIGCAFASIVITVSRAS